MKNSVVNIESVTNSSFGTGFVIDSNEKGVFILTCQHVLDDVQTPVVENVLAKVVAKSDFIDMAVLFVSKLHLESLPLQIDECDSLDVEVIGFSHFNKSVNQKKHIDATLYKESIELHSNDDDLFYSVRKIKANDGFNFDRGNSGSPVICKNSGKVIAMISNKEGSDIGYAVDIVNLKDVWEEMPSRLLREEIVEVSGKTIIEEKIEPIKTITQQEKIVDKKNKTSAMKYIFPLLLAVIISVGTYIVFQINNVSNMHKIEKKVIDNTIIHKPSIKKNNKDRALEQERIGFQALIDGEYKKAIVAFDKANRYIPGFHNVYDIREKIRKNIDKLENNPIQRRRILRSILEVNSWRAPEDLLQKLRERID